MRKLFAALLILISTSAHAGSRVWITEFAPNRVEAQAPIAQLPAIVKQPALDLSAGTAKRSAVFTTTTRVIRIICEVQCAFSSTNLATVTDIVLPALRPEYFGVQGGSSISVIAAP